MHTFYKHTPVSLYFSFCLSFSISLSLSCCLPLPLSLPPSLSPTNYVNVGFSDLLGASSIHFFGDVELAEALEPGHDIEVR